MVTATEAVTLINDSIPLPKMENVDLSKSLGLVLAQTVIAPDDEFPSCDISLMDGFAVNWEGVQSNSLQKPVRLKIIGKSQAGEPFNGKVENGEAIQISTGAMLPDGTDTIIPLEDCKTSENYVSIFKVDKINQFIRFKGAQIKKGKTIAQQGMILSAPLIEIMASVGISHVPIYRKPSVAIIVTGNELVAFYRQVKEFQVRDSNRIMLSAAVENCGGKVRNACRVKDNAEHICERIKTSAEENELIIVAGGSSDGVFDFTKQAVRQAGFELLFEGVSQKPGKSFFCARKEETLLFGLPGQPQAAHLCFAHYISPVIKKLVGKKFGSQKLW